MLAWFGADVLKVERITGGDVTRHQLRDIPDVDALYFTMLNSNKRSLAINTKTPEGKEVIEKLICDADVLVETSRREPWTAWGSPGSTSTNSTPG
jgi:formyl-CoA transferase